MTATYSITRDEVIKGAMQLCLALGQGESPTTQDITDSLPFLQSMLKNWNTRGYNTWLFKTINWPSVAAKVSYTIGTGGDVAEDRPVRMPQAWTQDVNKNRQPLAPQTRQQFEMLTPQSTPGPPNSYLYDRQLGLGVFTPWPVPSDTSLTFYALVQRSIADLAANGAATFDLDQEWYLPLIWNLAAEIMSLFGTEEQQCRRIEAKAMRLLEEVSAFAEEEGSVFFQPNPQGGSGRGRR